MNDGESNQLPPPSAPAADWYPDPSGEPDALRYWDGNRWTEQRAKRDPTALQQSPPATNVQAWPWLVLIVCGFFGVLTPFGFINTVSQGGVDGDPIFALMYYGAIAVGCLVAVRWAATKLGFWPRSGSG